jgi:cytochrome P450
LRDPRGYSRKIIARYGKTTRFRALNGDGVAISDPELARQLFATDPDLFETPSVLGEVFGQASVLATAGPRHRKQRKLLNPRFHGSEIRSVALTMQRVIGQHFTAFERARSNGAVVVMSNLAQALTVDVILETVFGDGDLERGEGRSVLVRCIGSMPPSAVFSSILRTPLFPPWARYLRARRAFDAWVDRLLAARRAKGGVSSDILGMLMAARYDDGEPMDDAEIRDQIFALLIAGHETTAVALAWATYFLIREPAVLERLRAEILGLPEDAGPEAVLRAPYLQAVVKETLRIEPIVSDVARLCREPVAVGSWTVPAGELAVVNVCALLSDPEIYPEPSRFLPDRFLQRNYHAGEFPPFGGGSRRCLGASFAEMELMLAIAMLTRLDLVLADTEPEVASRRNITMGPARGVRVKVMGARRV